MDLLDALIKTRDAYRNAPPVGTKQNPYVVVIPPWLEQRCYDEGTTPQELADQTFSVPVRIEVVNDGV